MASLAISMDNVTKVFRKRAGFLGTRVHKELALDRVTLKVRRGETYGLLGPNGSGKSTLIRILSTLLLADGGTVEVLGLRLPQQEREVRECIGRVGVDAAFYKKLSARENLVYTGYLYGHRRPVAEKKAFEILTRLGQDPKRFNDPLEGLSRGMQQKVSLTRALLVNPPLLLLDEPTTGLDPKSKRELQRFIETLRREENVTILLTTHDTGEAERLCDRIGILEHGRLVAEGTLAELKEKAAVVNLEEVFLAHAGGRSDETEKEPVCE
jgi:ABC-2 type transport system ATP-binding protein